MTLQIDPEIAALLEERGITRADVEGVVALARQTGGLFTNRATGHHLACHRPSKVTFWVECAEAEDGCRIVSAYSHRMKVLEGFNLLVDAFAAAPKISELSVQRPGSMQNTDRSIGLPPA